MSLIWIGRVVCFLTILGISLYIILVFNDVLMVLARIQIHISF